METNGADPRLSPYSAQLAEIIQHFIRLRARLRSVFPDDEEIQDIIARLVVSHPEGKAASAADFDLLFHVCVVLSGHREPITMGELSQALDVPLSTATRIVDWLVRNDYAERLSDPTDRRVVRVSLTETGEAVYEVGNRLIQNRVEALLRPFTVAERENLVALANKLVTAFENEVWS
jgi:DNA-binding MarR family transcriptional regulator